jgi:hypothetical protein
MALLVSALALGSLLAFSAAIAVTLPNAKLKQSKY